MYKLIIEQLDEEDGFLYEKETIAVSNNIYELKQLGLSRIHEGSAFQFKINRINITESIETELDSYAWFAMLNQKLHLLNSISYNYMVGFLGSNPYKKLHDVKEALKDNHLVYIHMKTPSKVVHRMALSREDLWIDYLLVDNHESPSGKSFDFRLLGNLKIKCFTWEN